MIALTIIMALLLLTKTTVTTLPTIAALLLPVIWGAMAIQTGGVVKTDLPGLSCRIEGRKKE